VQVFVTLPVQHGATVEQKLRSLIVEIFHRLPTSEARHEARCALSSWAHFAEQTQWTQSTLLWSCLGPRICHRQHHVRIQSHMLGSLQSGVTVCVPAKPNPVS